MEEDAASVYGYPGTLYEQTVRERVARTREEGLRVVDAEGPTWCRAHARYSSSQHTPHN